MGANSKIEWTDHTFNPWRGCTKVAAGCANCYAARDAKRFPDRLGIWGDDGTRVVAADSTWEEPEKWNKQLFVECLDPFCRFRRAVKRNCLDDFCPACDFPEAKEVRARIFCASLADVFEDWSGQMQYSDGTPAINRFAETKYRLNNARSRLFSLIDATPNLDWLLLTKRPENIQRFWSASKYDHICETSFFRKNVWLGTSIATQEDADRNIPLLLKCRDLAPVLFVSAEPLLGPVNLCVCRWRGESDHREEHDLRCPMRDNGGINWLIVGGESGHGARPMHPDWARGLRDQCTAAGVPFFFKQWGEWGPFDECMRSPKSKYALRDGTISGSHDGLAVTLKNYGKSKTGRFLDGREWNEVPAAAGVTS